MESSEIGGDADVGKLRSLITEVQTDTHLLKGEQEELRLQQGRLTKDVSRLKSSGEGCTYTYHTRTSNTEGRGTC